MASSKKTNQVKRARQDAPRTAKLPFNIEPDGKGIELVFGFVGPTGVDLGKVFERLKSQLKAVDYTAVQIRLSELINPYLLGKAQRSNNE